MAIKPKQNLTNMFKIIFYAIGVFYLLYEVLWLSSPYQKSKDSLNFHNLGKQHKGKKWKDYSEEYKSELKSKAFLIIFAIWPFLGLFTFQWIAFLAFVIYVLVLKAIIFAPIKPEYLILRSIVAFIDAAITITFIIFVIVNTYHLHIDLYKEVVQRLG